MLLNGGERIYNTDKTTQLLTKFNSSANSITTISQLENNISSLCDKIEKIQTQINEDNIREETGQKEINVKLTNIDDNLDRALKQYIEQKLFDIIFKAMANALTGKNIDDDKGETMLSVLKELRDLPKDVNINNDNFDSVLTTLLFKTNY